jgi:diguanylate cyclase (GGDEF)-like protein/PAS domain S-box-containing protein
VFAYLLHLHRKQLKTITDEVKLTASVFNHAKESITITDAQGIIVNVNDTFTKTTGYSHEEVIGKNPNILKSGRQSKEFYQEMWRSLRENGHWYGEVWNRRKDGQVYAEMKTISAIYDKRGKPTHFLALCSDITSLKEKQHHLEHIAHHDALTGLPNRTLLTDRINQAIIHSKRGNSVFAVVFIDLDGFKAINDTHGHDVGDELLITLSRRMQAALREGDTLARIGGDEFIAVLTNLGHAKDTEVVLSRLLDVACSDVTVEGLTVSVSASMGVTLYPEDEVDPEKLVLHADQAMYIAKRSGKNRCHFFDINKDVDVTSRQQIINSVRDALATDNLVLHYQPKINLNTGDVIGVEGLLRMQQQDALVVAGEFMPAILNSDLDIQVGKWVIEHAIKQSIDWQKQGLDLTLSINISTHHLQQVDFVAHLNELLHAYPDFDTQRLKFEILESSTMKDTTHIYNVICSCQALGIHFILDNFGTGYSSITHLQQLPGCSITLDHSLTKAMHDDPYQTSLVKGVIELAKSFKREVIAKGIENEASKRALQELGCELAQGFDIAPPMSVQDLTVWINA